MRWYVHCLMIISLVFSFGSLCFSKSRPDKSQILTWITNTNAIFDWDGVSFGWDADDRVIDGNWTLTYTNGSTNSVSNVNGVKIPPSVNANIGESGSDSKFPNQADALTKGECRGMWVTWDTNGLYIAVQGDSKGRADNIMLMIDRLAGVGTYKFSTMNTGWKRNINFNDWEPDMYIGFWGDNDQVNVKGSQLYKIADCVPATGITSVWNQEGSIPDHTTANFQAGKSNYTMRYNREETNVTKRVALYWISWGSITNGMNPITGTLKIKFASATTGPDDGNPVYDFCPDNLGGVDINNPSTFSENNIEVVPFTNGALNTNYSPAVEGKIVFLPGSIILSTSVPTNFNKPVNSFGDSTTYLLPDKNDKIIVNIPSFASIGYLGNATVTIYDMYGRKVRTIYDGAESIKPDTVAQYLSWDGKNDSGQIVGNGTYLIIVSGYNPTGTAIKLKSIINVLR